MRRLVNSASQFASSAVCHVNASGPYLRMALTEKWRVTKSSSLRAADHFRARRLECPTDLFCKEGPVINYFTRNGRKLALDSALGPLLITAPGSYLRPEEILLGYVSELNEVLIGLRHDQHCLQSPVPVGFGFPVRSFPSAYHPRATLGLVHARIITVCTY